MTTAMKPAKLPKVIIDMSGGLIQSIVADVPFAINVIDYKDIESGEGTVIPIDGNLAYVYSGIAVEVDPERAESLHRQITQKIHHEIAPGNIKAAAQLVIDRWEKGDLAEAIRELSHALQTPDPIAALMEQYDHGPNDTWGEHPDFPFSDWCQEAAVGDTRLGYWEWVAHNLETAEFDKGEDSSWI